MNELETLKKKIIYRANYRGTKEMDILLSKFVDKYINSFSKDELYDLFKFLPHWVETPHKTNGKLYAIFFANSVHFFCIGYF